MAKIYRKKRYPWGEEYYKEEEETVLTDEDINDFFVILIYGVIIFVNVSIAYLWSGGDFSDFRNDTWIPFLKLHFFSYVLHLFILTVLPSLLCSFVSDYIDELIPKIAGVIGVFITFAMINSSFQVIGKIQDINDTETLLIGIIAITLTLISLYLAWRVAFISVNMYVRLGYWIREKVTDIFDR